MSIAKVKEMVKPESIKEAVNTILRYVDFGEGFVPKETEAILWVGEIDEKWDIEALQVSIVGKGVPSEVDEDSIEDLKDSKEELKYDLEIPAVDISICNENSYKEVCWESKTGLALGAFVYYNLTLKENEEMLGNCYKVDDCTCDEVDPAGAEPGDKYRDKVIGLLKSINKTQKDPQAFRAI